VDGMKLTRDEAFEILELEQVHHPTRETALMLAWLAGRRSSHICMRPLPMQTADETTIKSSFKRLALKWWEC